MLAGRIAHHNRMVRNILCHDAAGRDKRVFSNAVTADDGGVRADAGALPNGRVGIKSRASLGVFAPRALHVGKHHGGSAENIVAQFHALINGYVILNFAKAADFYSRRHKYVLPDGAVFADFGAAADVTEMPHFCTVSNFRAVIHTRAGMYKKIFRAVHINTILYQITASTLFYNLLSCHN